MYRERVEMKQLVLMHAWLPCHGCRARAVGLSWHTDHALCVEFGLGNYQHALSKTNHVGEPQNPADFGLFDFAMQHRQCFVLVKIDKGKFARGRHRGDQSCGRRDHRCRWWCFEVKVRLKLIPLKPNIIYVVSPLAARQKAPSTPMFTTLSLGTRHQNTSQVSYLGQ